MVSSPGFQFAGQTWVCKYLLVGGVEGRGDAYLAVLVGELESVDQTKSLVYAAANREVVDRDLSKISLHPLRFKPTPQHTCRTTPFGSIKNSPRSAMPSSSIRTP
jgi:hypothetical protein